MPFSVAIFYIDLLTWFFISNPFSVHVKLHVHMTDLPSTAPDIHCPDIAPRR